MRDEKVKYESNLKILTRVVEHELMIRTLKTFKIIKMRLKISFECVRSASTLKELFLNQINESF